MKHEQIDNQLCDEIRIELGGQLEGRFDVHLELWFDNLLRKQFKNATLQQLLPETLND